ncbi:retrovirus-related pol polyprotein from transposon TNT 1-94 [Tanacetum coccineum]|uniref:Retrovirus-related pol polyprotein from transposon TNT 1-94 n=1 Tax=Tanacetum coccineum TaxID=301880 RepID=A0ABQ5IHN2_9ASTR
MDELIVHVSEKTYAYGAIRADNGSLSTKNLAKDKMWKKLKKVVTTQESQINKTKSGLSSTGVNATSRVRRPMSKDSSVTTVFLVQLENVIDVDVANASKAKTLLCVSCMQNVLIPCHDKCSSDRSVGLGHNLFSVGQFCDGDLEVAFRSNTCYVRNLEGDDLLTGGRDSNLYTISISDMAASSPVCLVSKATSTKSWLWHQRLSHLNFGTINDLTRLDLVDGLPKFKYGKDHLCSACERGKSKKASHPPKLVPSDYSKLELLHMDLCGPMRVASINGKKYILVIVDDFSRYTWVYFLRSKDETPEIIKKFITQAQLNYKAKVCKIRTDNVHEDSPSTSSIIVDTHEAPPVVTTSDEQTSPISLTEADEFDQEDTADFDGNAQFVPYNPLSHEENYHLNALEPQMWKARELEFKETRLYCDIYCRSYVSLSTCCAQVIWMRTQLLDYGFKYNRIPMYCDSKSAIAISCNPVQHSKTKHIDIWYHFIKEHVERGTVEIYFVKTEYQLADLFTKALPKERFEYLVHRIGMGCMTPTELESLTKVSS